MARRNAKQADEKYGVLRDISSNWSPTKAARLLVEFEDRTAADFTEHEDLIDDYHALIWWLGRHPKGTSEDLMEAIRSGRAHHERDMFDDRIRTERRVATNFVAGGGLQTSVGHVVSPEMLEIVCAAADTLDDEDVPEGLGLEVGQSGTLLLPRPVSLLGNEVQAIHWSLDVPPKGWPAPVISIFLFGRLPGTQFAEAFTLLSPETRNGWANSLLDLRIVGSDAIPPGEPVRFLFAFLRLAEQRTTAETIERVPADPGTPKRAPRPEQDVRVTYLRRSASPAPKGEKREVDWDHRWVVSMHKTRQWYPKEQKHKIIFRGPYVKGPADKPIRTTPTVRALVR